jgi:two-component system response regulator AtoC
MDEQACAGSDARLVAEGGVVVGASLEELLRQSVRVAPRKIPVLVTGETGVGKEVFVRRFHELAARSGPLQVVNCAALPPDLSESMLFGHERGAFTSAERAAVGLVAKADKGTLFLDEIGELPARGQAALLRVLQEGRILPVGSTCERAVDVRIVAATHRDLDAMVAEGSFRSDLLYRLNAVVFHIPALRERRHEIAGLARLFLRLAVSEWNMHEVRLSAAALERLQAYSWPGNVRQLGHLMRRMVAPSRQSPSA